MSKLVNEAVIFFHDTHKIQVITQPELGRSVYSGVGHFTYSHFPIDSRCNTCQFSGQSGEVCTIKMNVQLNCMKLTDGTCGHLQDCTHELKCKNGGEWDYSNFGTTQNGISDKVHIVGIPRENDGTTPVPSNGLCHAYKRKEVT